MPHSKFFVVCIVWIACVGLMNACTPPVDESGTEVPAPDVETETMSVPEPAAVTEPAPEEEGITAKSLVGTTWAIADYTVTFEDGGVVRFNSGSEGTWTLADDTITITVAGEDTVINIEGDTLMHDGMALKRQ